MERGLPFGINAAEIRVRNKKLNAISVTKPSRIMKGRASSQTNLMWIGKGEQMLNEIKPSSASRWPFQLNFDEKALNSFLNQALVFNK